MIRAEFLILILGIIVLVLVLRAKGKRETRRESNIPKAEKRESDFVGQKTILYIVVLVGVFAIVNGVFYLFFPERWLSLEFIMLKVALFLAVLAGIIQSQYKYAEFHEYYQSGRWYYGHDPAGRKARQAGTIKGMLILATLLIFGYILWGPKEITTTGNKKPEQVSIQHTKVQSSSGSAKVKSEWKHQQPVHAPYMAWSWDKLVPSYGHLFHFEFEGKVDFRDADGKVFAFENLGNDSLSVIMPDGRKFKGTKTAIFARAFGTSHANDRFWAMAKDKPEGKSVRIKERRVMW